MSTTAFDLIKQLYERGLESVEPTAVTAEALNSLSGFRGKGRIVVVAIGKAAIAMAAGAQDALGAAFERGYVLTVDGPDAAMLDDRWRVLRGGHPIPDQRGIDATRTIIDAVEELEPDDVILALISGGGSALFESPHEPLTLDDFAALTRLLLNAGAPIQHLNTVRIPLSDVKGGSFRQRSRAAVFVTLILSDVLGNNPQIIASGPTVEPATSGAAALAILDLYGLRETVPSAVRTALNEAAAADSDWNYPADSLSIIGDNQRALELAETAARSRGIESDIVWTERQGEASDLGREWVAMLLNLPAGVRMAWGGGEATVTVRGEGNGGRNTEFALAAALELDRLENDDWIVASLATDGQDATTGSAGAIASRQSILRGRELGLDPQDFLDRNDSATFFVQTGDLIVTGPSGTNVNDLYVGLRKP
ncbi:MAG: DUF4147 domain-containing protein [Thermomicrobiales bacterium]|nr:DUF4147 domain-containing protein [Thermomicrobiales bacterium]